jgi:hypothetical protein
LDQAVEDEAPEAESYGPNSFEYASATALRNAGVVSVDPLPTPPYDDMSTEVIAIAFRIERFVCAWTLAVAAALKLSAFI